MRMNRKTKISLQTKILTLISSLILLVIVLLAAIFSYLQALETKRHVEQLSLQAARSVALMPAVISALDTENPYDYISPIALKVKDEIQAADIIIENRNTIVYSSSKELIGSQLNTKSNFRALIFGGTYIYEDFDSEEPALFGTVPITSDFGEYDKVIGTVTVKFLKKDVYKNLFNQIKTIIVFSIMVLIIGIIGGIFLARSIRKDTLGLEPHEIASLYRERNAILLSIREGVIASDENGMVTMINHSAYEMLHLSDESLGLSIEQLIPDKNIIDAIISGKEIENAEIHIIDKIFIFNIIPIVEDGIRLGVVASFRDKTELKNLMDTISEFRSYSEGLRAQTHEFTNKLYLLSGLLQLGRYNEAIEFIQIESNIHQTQNQILFSQIKDPNVQAILLGKLGKASEKKVQLEIDPNSSTSILPAHIELSHLVTIIGNLVDNAFDAVKNQVEKWVSFSITDIGNDIIIEVIDNGRGIDDSQIELLFSKGFSSKGENRGYGLYNVKVALELLKGSIEISQNQGGGAIFTVYLPKNDEK